MCEPSADVNQPGSDLATVDATHRAPTRRERQRIEALERRAAFLEGRLASRGGPAKGGDWDERELSALRWALERLAKEEP